MDTAGGVLDQAIDGVRAEIPVAAGFPAAAVTKSQLLTRIRWRKTCLHCQCYPRRPA